MAAPGGIYRPPTYTSAGEQASGPVQSGLGRQARKRPKNSNPPVHAPPATDRRLYNWCRTLIAANAIESGALLALLPLVAAHAGLRIPTELMSPCALRVLVG